MLYNIKMYIILNSVTQKPFGKRRGQGWEGRVGRTWAIAISAILGSHSLIVFSKTIS